MRYIKFLEDYSKLAENVKWEGKGFINIKVDNDLRLRVGKYLSFIQEKYGNLELMDKLNKINSLKNGSFEDRIIFVVILQYFNELKELFDGSASGFIIENLFEILIGGERTADNGQHDIIKKGNNFKVKKDNTSNEYISYQIKFYKSTSSIILNKERLSDRTIVCVKLDNIIDIIILSKDDILGKFIGKFNEKDNKLSVQCGKLSRSIDNNYKVKLDMNDIGVVLENLKQDLDDSVDKVYKGLSELHEIIDNLMIGKTDIGSMDDSINKIKSGSEIIKNHLNNK